MREREFIMEFYNSIKTSKHRLLLLDPTLERARHFTSYIFEMHPLSVSCYQNLLSLTGCCVLSLQFSLVLIHESTTRWKSAINFKQLSSLMCAWCSEREEREMGKRVQQICVVNVKFHHFRACRPPTLVSMDRYTFHQDATNGSSERAGRKKTSEKDSSRVLD